MNHYIISVELVAQIMKSHFLPLSIMHLKCNETATVAFDYQFCVKLGRNYRFPF